MTASTLSEPTASPATPPPAVPPQLALDARQRAMLAEMGLGLGWPSTESAVSVPQLPEVQKPAAMSTTQTTQKAPVPPSLPSASHLDWAALQTSVAGCQACGLCQSRTRTVFGTGDPQARWMVVGEAPGEHEDQQGEPFVGQAGQLLDNMLKAMRLHRGATGPHGVFISNVLKCRPPSNRNPTPQEVLQCEPFLRQQVALVQPRVILALGRFAAQSLLQQSLPEVASLPLGKLRGQVHHYQGVPVVVSYHPAYLLRAPEDKAKAWADLCLAMELMPATA
ncbi:MAG: uracil-DNA glycosylase [Betaproteobacteria bacterium]|nr:uracil-DNA glycosylase [Betaproteobacteria bacterium]